MSSAEPRDHGLFGPGSVTWRVHSDPSRLVGGLRALLVQALHPLAMAGVDQHSNYRDDSWARLRQTTEYVVTTTFADTATAEATGAVVQALESEGFRTFTIPVGTLIVIVVAAALAGVIAAIGPARRASKLNVLRAITVE